ncbi:V/A-type H+-transporting ATPase subunit K [Anaerobacterium chartisolvens]|uniref:V/A-type H+-transporting ATPase subunit K n=1 Tax=Anaerobacterium chartisolvens TaxID=1297424 RepID=A0A369B847_9FIRM|nr:V-type ATP synthase subunit K [Anaerobacterium chartisolvens]RCX17485.1 V/A-type H+-transporting ATPase subunit K [Anaerobacterium chartisolvens]
MEYLFGNLDGSIWAMLGAAVAFFVAGMGSAKGVGIAGEAGAGVLTEDPGKFGPVMVMEALPSTQAIYGFVIAFLIIGNVGAGITLQEGLFLFAAGIPVGLVGLMSGIYQGRVAAAGINMIAKRSDSMGRAIILALMVEMFAIIAFIVSILMIGKV